MNAVALAELALTHHVPGFTRPDTHTSDDGIAITFLWRTEYYIRSWHDDHSSHVFTGTCLQLADQDVLGHTVEAPDGQPGGQWNVFTGHPDRPMRINGVPDAELPAAIDLLLDAGRAERAETAALRRLAKNTRTELSAAREAYAAAWIQRPNRTTAAEQKLMRSTSARLSTAVRGALTDGVLPVEEIQDLAGHDDFTMLEARSHAARFPQPARLHLDRTEFAARLGVAVLGEEAVPAADTTVEDVEYWLVETAEAEARRRIAADRRTRGDA